MKRDPERVILWIGIVLMAAVLVWVALSYSCGSGYASDDTEQH